MKTKTKKSLKSAVHFVRGDVYANLEKQWKRENEKPGKLVTKWKQTARKTQRTTSAYRKEIKRLQKVRPFWSQTLGAYAPNLSSVFEKARHRRIVRAHNKAAQKSYLKKITSHPTGTWGGCSLTRASFTPITPEMIMGLPPKITNPRICIPYIHSSNTLLPRLRCACTEGHQNISGVKDAPKLINLVNSQETVVAPADQRFLERMALVTSTMWHPGRTITIGFLDGSPIQRRKVKKQAVKWLKYANLKFSWARTRHKTANIRISFKEEGSWSTIGTDALTVPVGSATTNFGWIRDDTDDAECERVVLHEFGHVLGCVHEHQNPAGGIHWNKPAVYAYFQGPPNNWSKADIDLNLFDAYSKDTTQFSKLDPLSIMAYSFPASFTLDGFSIPWNTTLSTTDIEFVKEEYPK